MPAIMKNSDNPAMSIRLSLLLFGYLVIWLFGCANVGYFVLDR
jgi:hypothetical protein